MPPKSRLTVAQLKAELDTLGVPYDAKAKKAVLVDLLEKVRRQRETKEREVRREGAGVGEAASTQPSPPRAQALASLRLPLHFRPD